MRHGLNTLVHAHQTLSLCCSLSHTTDSCSSSMVVTFLVERVRARSQGFIVRRKDMAIQRRHVIVRPSSLLLLTS